MSFSREHAKEQSKRIYMQRRMLKECTQCGEQDERTLQGRGLWNKCNEKNRESSRRFKEMHKDELKRNANTKKTAERTVNIFKAVECAQAEGISYGVYMSKIREG